MNANVVTNH